MPEWAVSWIVAGAAGMLGAMGLGGGGVLLLWLALTGTEQRAAQGINLLFILPVGLAGLWLHRKNNLTDFSLALPIVLGGVPGVLAGSFLAGLVSEALLSRIFGWLVLLIAAREIWSAVRLFRREGFGLFVDRRKKGP